MAFLAVNGEPHELHSSPDRMLLHVLREDLLLTGPKLGCAEGACGACTVLLDGEPVRACVTSVAEVGERKVTTIEGLGTTDALHPVQGAFVAEGAFQCGYCTGGMVLAAAALLDHNPHPTDAQIVDALQGNICRCGTYPRILRTVQRAAGGSADAEPMPRPPVTDPVQVLPMPGPWDRLHDTGPLFDALGDGLLVVPDDDGGAWLHVGADGRITVASGKVDVGQGSTAELARVAARELGVQPETVRVLLGDTHLCPYDMGTFGSMTTPNIVPAVRAAAATARAWLRELDPGATAPAGYGPLVRGRRIVEPVQAGVGSGSADSASADVPEGPAVERRDVVTGQRRYTSDLRLPGMLHGAVLRPPAFGATLWDVDVSAAERLPGVRVVREADFVAVAAPSLAEAGAAIERLRATWEGGGGIGQAELIGHLRSHPVDQPGWGGNLHEEHGDVDAVLAAGPIRCDATYTTAYLAHEPLETRAALAAWEGDHLTVWTGGQRPFGVREQLATAFDLPEEQIRVIAAPTGAAYGGKHTGEAAIEAARIARAVDSPVHVRWTREEETTWAYQRPAAVIDVRSAAGPDGRLLAWEFSNTNSGPHAIRPPYRIAAQRLVYQPAASPLRQGSYRALSATANAFARESHIDEMAHQLGEDPVDFRLRNLADERLAAVLRAAAERAGWPGSGARPGSAPSGQALGIACGTEKDSRVATCAEVQARAGEPLQLLRIVTAFECGAIIDRENLENQVMGATVMGLGGALFEEVRFDGGRVTNAAQSAYRVPRFRDVPPIEVVLLDRPDLTSAGAGETPIIAIAPAIANAIHAASSVRIRSLPLVPDGIIPAPR